MLLTSLSFIYVLLPLALAAYYLAPGRVRPLILLAFSLLLYTGEGPRPLLLMAACVLMDYLAAGLMSRPGISEGTRRACLLFSVTKNALMIAYIRALAQLGSVGEALGILVYTLSGIDFVLSVYHDEVPDVKNPVPLLLYCCFYPRLYAGPLLSYPDFAEQLRGVRLRPAALARGLGRFVQGALKYAVLGAYIAEVYDKLRFFQNGDISVLSSWCMVFTLALSLYYRLSGLCDMAQGLGLAFGLRLPNNFYYPYQSLSVEDFLQRFNMTVHRFLSRTVYAGLQEDRNGPLSDCLNLLVVGMLTGVWFGLRINYVVWGGYLALFVILERYLFRQALQGMPTFFSRLYALCAVLSSFTIFAGESLGQSAGYLFAMFGGGGLPVYNDKLLYLLSSNWLALLLGVFFAFSLAGKAFQLLRGAAPRLAAGLQGACDLGLLALLTTMKV